MKSASFVVILSSLIFFAQHTAVFAGVWTVPSPDKGQTFSYGSERHRAWVAQGRHLEVLIEFTNDPYVDQVNFRQYDDFSFSFPDITLGPDRKTFFYHPKSDKAVAVAVRQAGLFGADVRLLPSSRLLIEKRHGLLHLSLLVSNSVLPMSDDE